MGNGVQLRLEDSAPSLLGEVLSVVCSSLLLGTPFLLVQRLCLEVRLRLFVEVEQVVFVEGRTNSTPS